MLKTAKTAAIYAIFAFVVIAGIVIWMDRRKSKKAISNGSESDESETENAEA